MNQILETEFKNEPSRTYEVLGREKGTNKWTSFLKSDDWKYVADVFRRQTMTPDLINMEWKIQTLD